MKKSLYLILLFTAISYLSGLAQVPQALQNRFQYLLDSSLINPGVKGISACVIMRDNSVWTGHAGDNGSGVAITDSTVFYGGSTTKTFVATRIMQLWEEGLIKLDTTYIAYIDPIANVLPQTTIRQMLTHTSGIFDVILNPSFKTDPIINPTHFFTPQEVLATYLNQPHVFAPGTDQEYSNSNYIILAMIVEAITGNPLHFELRNHVFNLIPLKHTYTGAYETFTEPYCGLWTYIDSTLTDLTSIPHTAILSMVLGAGNIVSYPPDEAWFIRNLINGNILSQAGLAEMLQLSPFDNNYGLGMMAVQFGQDTMVYGHGGSIGNLTEMFHCPKLNLTVVVMINSENGDLMPFFGLFLSAYSSILGIEENSNSLYSFSLFPNPSNEKVYVRLDDYSVNDRIEIFSASGLLMKTVPVTGKGFSIDISDLPRGIYFVKNISVKRYPVLKLIRK